jgi:hypothetical protein
VTASAWLHDVYAVPRKSMKPAWPAPASSTGSPPTPANAARVRLLGDPAQLTSVEVCCALRLLAHEVGVVEFTALYRSTDSPKPTSDGVVLLDAPPTIGNNIQPSVDETASFNGVGNRPGASCCATTI